MAFVELNSGGKFVCWGKKKAKENSFVVEEGKSVTGMVVNIKTSKKYGKILEIKSKDDEDNLIILGTKVLLGQMGFKQDKDGKVIEIDGVDPIKEGEVIRISFNGMIPTDKGNDAYDLKLEVDR